MFLNVGDQLYLQTFSKFPFVISIFISYRLFSVSCLIFSGMCNTSYCLSCLGRQEDVYLMPMQIPQEALRF